MSTLITMGCSFIQGVGIWYEDIEPIHDFNKDYHQERYLEYHHDVQLKNCIGSHLQKELGYTNFCNFGISGTSLSNQLRIWYEETPKINDDVLFLLFVTYPTRIGNYLNGSIGDVVNLKNSFFANYPYHFNDEETRDIKYTKLDLDLETIFYIKIIKEYCISRGWKFEYSLIDSYYESTYVNELGNPFPNPFIDVNLKTLDETQKCKLSPHPNKDGYELLSNELIKWIRENKKEWYKNEIPQNKYSPWVAHHFDLYGNKTKIKKNRF